MTLLFKKIHPQAVIPSYAHPEDIGLDLYSVESVIVPARQRVMISTGLSAALPIGYAALIWDRSGLAAKNGLTVLAGVIDPNYRGEWKVILYNTSDQDYEVNIGDRIAQALIQEIDKLPIEEVTELPESNRGEGGFGSSGK